MDKLETCLKILREQNFRLTRQRVRLLKCLCHQSRPLTPKEIVSELNLNSDGQPPADLASVYRVTEQLKIIKLLHEVHPSRGFFLCLHQKCGHQFHLLIFCTRCQFTEEKHIPNELTQPMLWFLKNKASFAPEEHFLQISGLCKQCQNATPSTISHTYK